MAEGGQTRPGWWPPNEAALLEETSAELPGEEVLAAGVFTLEAMIGVAAVGGAAGGLVGGAAGGLVGGAADDVGNVVGAVAGMRAAKQSYAASQGTTVELAVAVTPERIHVLNRDASGSLPAVVASFDRSSCEVKIVHAGPSRFLHLTDPESGQRIELSGTLLSKPDREVMKLLAGHKR